MNDFLTEPFDHRSLTVLICWLPFGSSFCPSFSPQRQVLNHYLWLAHRLWQLLLKCVPSNLLDMLIESGHCFPALHLKTACSQEEPFRWM